VSHDRQTAIANLFSTIKVESPHEFSLAGRKFTAAANPTAQANPAAPPVNPLLTTLSSVLYGYVYSRSFTGQLPPDEPADYTPDPALMAALSAANTTRERWEHGWQIAQVMQAGQVMAQKGNVFRSLWPGQFISKDGPGAPPRAGAIISVFYAKESTSLQPGFYYLFGETAEDESHGFGLVRFYWNISMAGAPRLVQIMGTRLNRFQVPFRFKVATARSQFDRTDVAVLYFAKRFFSITADLSLDVHRGVREFLGEDVPFFTKKVAAGVGIAEDPGNGESFGQSRCRLAAESVWNCYLRGDQSPRSRLQEFRRLLSANGVDPDHPHLNAGSVDWYELPEGTP
jgi:hypothetical protein